MAHRVAGDLYFCPHRLHRVHLLQLSADRGCVRGASGRVLGILQGILRHLGLPGAADRLTMHIVRKLAHFCEYLLEGFLLMLCLRVYTRHFFKHVSWPVLGGLLTALTDETIQLFVPGRSGQVTDIWIDFSGVMTGLLVGLILLGLVRMCIILYQHRNEV